MKRTLAALLLLLLAPAWGEPIQARLPAAKLRELGINTFTFRPAVMSSDGLTLLAMEKTFPEERMKGTFNRLWVIKLGVDGQIRETRSVKVPSHTLEGVAFTADERAAVVISHVGATFTNIPLDGAAPTVLMEHKRGTPGFRAHPSFLRQVDGQLLTIGYFYDASDFTGDTLLALVNPQATGQAAFTKGAVVQQVELGMPGFYAASYTSAQTGFLATKQANRHTLYWFQAGQEPRLVDESERISSFWAAGNRVVYTITRAGMGEAVVYDSASGQKHVLGSDRTTYNYPFLSDDGRTAVVSQIDMAQSRMDILYAKEGDGWKLKPVPGLQKVKMGAIRVAPNGRFLSFYNGDFLQFVELP